MNVFPERITDDRGSAKIEGGMSLRDYFAAACAAGICAHPNTMQNTPGIIAEEAYSIADAMLRAREG